MRPSRTFFKIPTTTSVVTKTVALAHRPGLGPLTEITQVWVPIKVEPIELALCFEFHNSVHAQLNPYVSVGLLTLALDLLIAEQFILYKLN